jgi:hypothetical protein
VPAVKSGEISAKLRETSYQFISKTVKFAGDYINRKRLPETVLPELSVLLPFLLASVGLTLLPGPDNLFVLSLSAMHGAKTGVPTALGMAIGNFAHTAAVALYCGGRLRVERAGYGFARRSLRDKNVGSDLFTFSRMAKLAAPFAHFTE